ncbi:UDP-N-acetylmuramoylalanyl-D-glutamyl-2,6-diaminopimelate--D-alanyl-D-alanyl ligase [Methylorubrum populi BJ001]|jgi:UDP-N-acetylmuramoyl-tripeptide--D-alanyl-D-alanine ligase|uniref:UDP-N-acetylmuramoyl-tripeptide--D-alanyl-D-alanine ligase n=1 Tax=Methylorubrum populi (strain ATCC BAA-705 / NCIMB 13946 / BJ001) TaxID=441620 RepID=B1Z8X0_METPB|nr:UDP-N-acetylmuramoylalanyl-D-glutamyl-2,6-diaminopimelate--D-alanyl-D-alanine ligase [Methylorubrum populi]ACB83270.1 UDP-N-acetylmuramoylalanyl-D-glutamyl-2,6-diaminopimelate--D-alanyl-D-alanyl ligase [Methylorubrum populi BJ001]OAH38237.1 UDP-N-acetylmuramoylalanyl-D-glutamyl-2, 6-diaminopimelate--D-alanyl-D-alanine ligase [Methylorubrum populi]PZP68220.1 MAG: UDP-N-acetylmuramoylalanyl-D-glutamyl-2,6-diaminopimelate--D-alanyl-D-alanine ligase [Methylorubrum populi]
MSDAPLWTPAALESATGGRLIGAPRAVTGASIDTRSLEPGDLFFAIRGEARDGHDFVRAALEKGAGAAVVAAARANEFEGVGPVLAVPGEDEDPVLEAMRRLGLAARARTGAAIVAVTGSVGKTGTKEALRHVLSAQGATHASVASYNNHWGVPLTLARMPEQTRFGVFEIGMNHGAEILPLTAMVRPDVALITTVEPVHIEHFRSLSAIADAKGEIFSGLKPGGVAVINRDNPNYERLLAHAHASRAGRVITFGEHAAADVRANRILTRPDVSVVDASVMGVPLTYQLGTPGRHVAMNSLGVLACIHALGADLARAALSLAALKPPVGRGERTALRVGDGEAFLIDESYNANPASIRAALATLAGIETGAKGRRIAVLGDMKELGAAGETHHRELADAVAGHGIDVVFAVGPLMAHLFEALPMAVRGTAAPSAEGVTDAVLATLRPGDAVMVKGSNSMRMVRIVEAVKARYAVAPDPREASLNAVR